MQNVPSYFTVPEVFLSTEAAKLWVTPTKLVPSTSTIRSFTWILKKQRVKISSKLQPTPVCHPGRKRNTFFFSFFCQNQKAKISLHTTGNKSTTTAPTSGYESDSEGFASQLESWFQRGVLTSAHLPSLWAAPPSVTVFTKMPSFSSPMSAPAPIPMILMPRPSPSAREAWSCQDVLHTEKTGGLFGFCRFWNRTASENEAPSGDVLRLLIF